MTTQIALNALRAKYAGMSLYQHAFIFAQEAAYRAGEVRHGNSVGSNAVRATRLASLIVECARREPNEQVRALAAKYVRIARSVRRAALAKDPTGYRANVSCYRRGFAIFYPN